MQVAITAATTRIYRKTPISEKADLVEEIGRIAEIARTLEEAEQQIAADRAEKGWEWSHGYAQGTSDAYRRVADQLIGTLDLVIP